MFLKFCFLKSFLSLVFTLEIVCIATLATACLLDLDCARQYDDNPITFCSFLGLKFTAWCMPLPMALDRDRDRYDNIWRNWYFKLCRYVLNCNVCFMCVFTTNINVELFLIGISLFFWLSDFLCVFRPLLGPLRVGYDMRGSTV